MAEKLCAQGHVIGESNETCGRCGGRAVDQGTVGEAATNGAIPTGQSAEPKEESVPEGTTDMPSEAAGDDKLANPNKEAGSSEQEEEEKESEDEDEEEASE